MPTARLNRTVLKISGEGAKPWLEGLITNSISGPLTFAALLTPQGKIIADFFVWDDDGLFVETSTKFGEALFKRLKMYRLRAPITIEDVSEAVSIYAVWNKTAEAGLTDPRCAKFTRLKSHDATLGNASEDQWDLARLADNIPDSERDFDTAETFAANANMDRLSGIDFKKGCYVGQEVVSRMHRKTTVRKRMNAFEFKGELSGNQITLDGRVVGDVLHTNAPFGMAMIRFDRLPEDGAAQLMIGETPVSLVEV
ncbi:MAG: YgfZ/GcvT domain-containing protein [Alphaproteobacteria bacterium]